MSKLIKLKEWVTIEQAAKHLSGIFEECVTDADVLQLALDGHLKISVNIPVYAYGRPGARKRLCDATIFVMPDWLLNLDRAIKSDSESAANNIEEEHSQIPTQIHTGIRVGEDEIIDFEDRVTKISGVWDLLMWGGERLFVERQFHSLMNDGAILDVSTFDGSYVQSYDRELVFSLQEHFGDIDGYPSDTPIRPLSHPNNYYPMDGLPKDSFLVIRTEALSEFENNLRFKEKSEMRTPQETLVEALGLMTLLLAETSPNLKHGNKPNFSQIKERIKLKAQQVFKLKGGETYPNLENINRDLKSAVEKLEAQAPK